MKKLVALLLCVLMMTAIAVAEISWPEPLTDGQAQLKDYVARVNESLAANKGGRIDVLYSLYSTLASFGMDGLELPDDPFAEFNPPSEISFRLTAEGLHSLTLRMQDPDRFASTAAACIHAASPTVMTYEQAYAISGAYAASVKANANRGFEEEVSDLQSTQPRAYFAYYPNQFKDEHNWLQLTLIFARPGSPDAPIILPISTPAPENTEDGVWLADDNYNHLEVFVTPTPEPDSAAME